MLQSRNFDLLYYSALRVYGEDHHIPRLLARAMGSGRSNDIEMAQAAIEVLPPHERARLMRPLAAGAEGARLTIN